MKKAFLIICILLTVGAVTGSATSPLDIKKNNIALRALTGNPTVKSNPLTIPVEACQNDTNVEVRFNRDMGHQNIVVTNRWGYPVFQQSVTATAGSSVVIPTQAWASGTYTIYILGQGGGLEGQFVK